MSTATSLFPSPSKPTLSLNHKNPLLHSPKFAAFKVTIEHSGSTKILEVEPTETILEKTPEEGLEVPHDCNMGVCMTCPARLLNGSIDQSGVILSEDVVERGYALLCGS